MAITIQGEENLPWYWRNATGGYGGVPPSGWGGQGAAPRGYGAAALGVLGDLFGITPAQAETINLGDQGGGPPTLDDSVTMAPPGQGALPQARGRAVPPDASAPPAAAQGPPGYLNSSSAAGGVPAPALGYYSGVQPGLSAPAMIRSPSGATTTPGAGPLPNVAAPDAQPVSATAPRAATPGPLANNDRFGTFSYQNPNSIGNRAPIYTALNLGSLFGGGQQAANPANVPAPNARPMVGGPLSKGGGMSKAPWNVGPLQKGMVWPKDMGPPLPPNSARARILRPDLYG